MVSWEYPPLVVGGISAHADGLARALARAGHDVVVLTLHHPDVPDDAEVDGVRVLRATAELPWLPDDHFVAHMAGSNHHLVALAARLKDWRPDVVHAHDWLVAWAGQTLRTWWGAPLVATIHATERGRSGGHLGSGQPSAINSVEWWLTYAATRVICCSQFMRHEVMDAFQLPGDKVDVVPNGVDPEEWAPAQEHGPSWRRRAAARVVGPGPVREGLPDVRPRAARGAPGHPGRSGRGRRAGLVPGGSARRGPRRRRRGHLRVPGLRARRRAQAPAPRGDGGRHPQLLRALRHRGARGDGGGRTRGGRGVRRARRGHRRDGRRRAVPAGGRGGPERRTAADDRSPGHAGRPADRGVEAARRLHLGRCRRQDRARLHRRPRPPPPPERPRSGDSPSIRRA